MKNQDIDKFKSKVRIAVKGKNVFRFIKRLHINKVNILDLNKINNNEYYLLIYFKDYNIVLKLNTIYEIYIVGYGGWESKKRSIKKNKFIIVGIIIYLLIVYALSNMIFKVEVRTNDTKMRDKLLYELANYGITKYKYQKSYKEIELIKSDILEKYKNEIEWLEIKQIGTKYIVLYEPRITYIKENIEGDRDIVAKKDALIYSVNSSKGQILKNKNEYVGKGDVIISGTIYLNEKPKETVRAEGQVYGEVWYEVDIFYPLGYYEQERTGNKKSVYVVKFLNWRLELFNFNKFYDKIIKEDLIVKNEIIPLSLVKESQEEVNTKISINTVEQAYEEAILLAVSKIKNKLRENEHIIKYKVVDKNYSVDGVNLKIFFSVCEDITDYAKINEVKNE